MSIFSRAARSLLFGAVAAGALFAAAPLASASPDYVIVDPNGNVVDGYQGNNYVGGTPSYDGVPGLLVDMSAYTGMTCWATAPYLANDGRYYDYACY